MNEPRKNRLSMGYGPDPVTGGQKVIINGMDVSWNVAKDGVEVRYDRARNAPVVTVTFVVDDLRLLSEGTRDEAERANLASLSRTLRRLGGKEIKP